MTTLYPTSCSCGAACLCSICLCQPAADAVSSPTCSCGPGCECGPGCRCGQ